MHARDNNTFITTPEEVISTDQSAAQSAVQSAASEVKVFNLIPTDVLLKIFSFLRPETLVHSIFLTNKKFKNIAQSNLLWLNKFELHFSDTYRLMLRKHNNKFMTTNINDIDGYAEFIAAYQDHYQSLFSKVARMFSVAIEGDHESLYDKGSPINMPLTWLSVTEKNGKTFLALVQALNNQQQAQEKINELKAKKLKHQYKPQELNYQKILDYFYHWQKIFFTDFNPIEGINTINTQKRNDKKKTILFEAIACHQKLEEITLLLSKGSSLDEKYSGDEACYPCYPIHIACKQGKLDLVEFILKERTDHLNLKDNFGRTPLMYAAQHGQSSVVECLLKKIDLDKSALTRFIDELHNGKSALHLAAEFGHTEVVIQLLNAGFDATIVSGDMGFLPLHWAVRAGKLDLVQTLIEKYPKQLNISDFFEQTSLLWAASKDYLDIVEYLVKKEGIDLNGKTQGFGDDNIGEGKTALHYAAEHGYDEVVLVLLEAGADAIIATPNLKDLPIHLAIKNNHLRSAKLLSERAPESLHIRDVNGDAPLMLAEKKGFSFIFEHLFSKDDDKKNCLTSKDNTPYANLPLLSMFNHSHTLNDENDSDDEHEDIPRRGMGLN